MQIITCYELKQKGFHSLIAKLFFITVQQSLSEPAHIINKDKIWQT